MCGIAGLCGYRGDAEKNIRRMNERLLHRGPDSGDIWNSPDDMVWLGHRRLSIRDLSSNGSQPMRSKSGKYVIVYNGEIYNTDKLSELLIGKGYVTGFRGTSDTEVLLEAIEYLGISETLKFCKGMFALAVYDLETHELCLARDRIGEKPLYYGFVNGSFVFASEITAIRAIEGFKNRIFEEALNLYFVHGYIPAPYTIYNDIYKLEPGTILRITAPFSYFRPVHEDDDEGKITGVQRSGGEYRFETYYDITEVARKGQENLFKGTADEAADELERLLKEAIKGQLVSDVPIGAFLSAGIDSSTVVSLMQEVAEGKVKTFTIGMEDPKYNEAEIAKEIARHLGTEHTELYITEADAKAVIPKLPAIYGEPFADSSQIPTYLVSKMTREHVTVSLSGDGGDELFCGYRSYESVQRIWNKMKAIPGGVRSGAGKVLQHSRAARRNDVFRDKTRLLQARSPEDLYRIQFEMVPGALNIAREKDMPPYKLSTAEGDKLREVNHDIMLMDMRMYHPDDILVKVDRSGMAVSLESRIPMLDRDVMEFAWSLPLSLLRDKNTGTGKMVLRDVLYRHVPRELVDRPKKGFSIPVAKWLKEKELRQWAEDMISVEKLQREGFLNPEAVTKVWKKFTEEDGQWQPLIWYILMFEQWLSENN
ncbi:asparagine synthase (glutamine-hydrolyzing) [Butyrivibrio sp. WCD3002]|uniref:asparagine synthase (glutamine-hydrolyzing) n=1 Tax=Butyrivibrio sp. WCD3002 TaxID=1280676 RepID=UPI000425551C|nr:asparagine synthase (glutamine-hydrolyzing) [Butyrivibrio sp. WCD3002]